MLVVLGEYWVGEVFGVLYARLSTTARKVN